ncbi:methyltransferase domain-containing protein [Aromatoleum diolicum]|uniref:Methyltransferase domain-containing protein n=1 Tax=Aromatoleum diolicum TaxID=75796 RepID=A0ABX1QDG7_9RHOO|nr:methyltransferase domain-containing protein [Aromatoleum diolicum]NMG75130.1 methyltransferase domain-containing protein [Aromatoleum diolicum]
MTIADHQSQSPAPSAWVQRFVPLIAPAGTVLDYACGGGRHARWLARQGFAVEAVDRDTDALASLNGVPGITTRLADLEDGPWPFEGRSFDAIVVTNYLYRPRLDAMLRCLKPGGVLIYETFMIGHERFGRPSNPEFLLQPGELLQRLAEGFTVVAFEQGEVEHPRPSVVQRICAVRTPEAIVRLPQDARNLGNPAGN